MSIYRGAGGSGDAVNDASSEATLVQTLVTSATTQAANAATSATSASNSASSASASASAASTAATNAQTAETNAETAETNAETAETNAASSASAASSSASTATTQAGIATTQATNASSSASAASTSATNASNSASAASTSATNASNSASAAATSATNAAASYDAFDDRYLGSKSSNPTVDNDGNALITGALYFNTVVPEIRVWTGSTWNPISAGGTVVTSFNTRNGDVTLSSSDVTTALTYTPLAPAAIGTTVQGYDADLQAIGAIAGTSGLLQKTAANTWSLDTNTYLTSAVTSVTGTSPVVSSGGTTPAISMPAATSSVNGYLTSTDWSTFNSKQAAGSYVTVGGALGTPSSGTLTNVTGLPVGGITATGTPSSTTFLRGDGSWQSVSATTANNLAGGALGSVPYQLLSGTTVFLAGNTTTTPQFLTSTGVAGLATAPTLTGSTGSGDVVLATSPTLVTPTLGSATATQLTTGAGSVSTPSITTTGDTNTGIFFPAADTIAFSEGGTESMRIDSSGNVGIGTASPTQKLDVVATSRYTFNVANAYTLQTSTNTDASAFADDYKNALSHIWQTSGTERMRITSAGGISFGSSGTAFGTSGQVLQSNGNAAPTWVSLRNGSQAQTSSSDITLTSSSSQVQVITITAVNKRVILPSTTTISPLSGNIFYIVNLGEFVFDIATTNGYRIAQVAPGAGVNIGLYANSVADEGWIIDGRPIDYGIGESAFASTSLTIENNSVAVNNSWNDYVSIAPLTSTTFMMAWVDNATADVYGVVGTVSGSTITYGTVTLLRTTTGAVISLKACSSTNWLLFLTTPSSNTDYIAGTLSGTTISVNATQPASSTGGIFQDAIVLNSTQFVYVGRSSAVDNQLFIGVITHNGSSVATRAATVVFGATGGFGSTPGKIAALTLIDTNKVGLLYCGFTAPGGVDVTSLNSRIVTISGTTPSFGTNVALPSPYSTFLGNGSGAYLYAQTISTSQYCVYAGNSYAFTFNVSGTTVTLANATIFNSVNPTVSNSYKSMATFFNSNAIGMDFSNERQRSEVTVVNVQADTGFGATEQMISTSTTPSNGQLALLDSTTAVIVGYNNVQSGQPSVQYPTAAVIKAL